MEVKIENGRLIVSIPVNAVPTESASGKTLIVASSHGNKERADVLVNGQPVYVSLNAYIYPPKA